MTTDKFAHIAALRLDRGASTHAREEVVAPEPASPEFDQLARLVGGEIRRNSYGEHLFVRRWYAAPEMHLPTIDSLSLLFPDRTHGTSDALKLAASPDHWLFLDTETTGVCGGTGTYAFMVGIAWWDVGGLQVEQLFMRDLNEEHSLLLELTERMTERPVLVTFNGKSFDWPLLETRYRMTRAISPSTPKAHLDMLHPARQLWRPRLGSVRLKELEWRVLGGEDNTLQWSRHNDIDSSRIPQMYFEYLRGGSAEPLAGIFEHNKMDLRGLAALAGKILAMLDCGNGATSSEHHSIHNPIDLYGLSRLLLRRGESARARELFENAMRAGLPQSIDRLARRELAQLAKRERDYTRATSLWEDLCGGPIARARKRRDPATTPEDVQKALEVAVEAAEQLAIHYERRAKQPERAEEVTRSAIRALSGVPKSSTVRVIWSRTMKDRLDRRLARLQRRIASKSPSKPLLAGMSSSPV